MKKEQKNMFNGVIFADIRIDTILLSFDQKLASRHAREDATEVGRKKEFLQRENNEKRES